MDVGRPRPPPALSQPAGRIAPASLREAYAAQEAYYRLAEPVYGPVGGAKIATTTKVMQELMGIDHPCGGAIFAAPSTTRRRTCARQFRQCAHRKRDRAELGADLPASGAPWTRATVAPAIAAAMPAFELIEDRNADYTDDRRRLADRRELLERRHRHRHAPKPYPLATSSASPAGSRSAASRSAKALPRTRARRWPGSPIISPSAAAGSKPAWW